MSKRKKIALKIFCVPTAADVTYEEAIGLLKGLGAVITMGSGSRVAVDLSGRTLAFHRPHTKELPKYVVEDIRELLMQMGYNP